MTPRGRGSAVDFICEFLHVLSVSARLLSATQQCGALTRGGLAFQLGGKNGSVIDGWSVLMIDLIGGKNTYYRVEST